MDYEFDDEGTPQERAMALAEAIRGKRNVGNLGLLTGDRVLGAFGNSQIQQAGQDSTLLRLMGRQRPAYQKSPEELAALAGLAKEREARAKALLLPKAPKETDQLTAELKRQRIERARLGNKIAANKLAGNVVKDLDDESFKWGNRIPEGTKAAWDNFAAMDAIEQKYGGLEKIPGIGFGAGAVDQAVLPQAAQEFKQTGLSIISAYRNKLFGASLTPGEKAAFDDIASLGGRATVSQVGNAIRILKRGFLSGAEQALAGAAEPVKERLFRDLGMPYKSKKAAAAPAGMSPEERAEFEALEKKYGGAK